MRQVQAGKGASRHIWVACQIAQMWWLAAFSVAEVPTIAGPAMGTTYRVRLAADMPGMPGMTRGEVHREVEGVLARIDLAASTWRNDSDASRFNRAAAGEWVTVSADLAAIVETAREVHGQSEGAFDITVGPLVRLWSSEACTPSAAAIAEARDRVGMRLVESRPPTQKSGAALRKSRAGVEIDLSGIAPGYAVDQIGERLLELGSTAHLVELGGEVRAWGQPLKGRPWRVLLRGGHAEGERPQEIDLPDGMALATSTCRPGRSPIDPQTGRPVTASVPRSAATVRAKCCAAADAWAVAALVLDLDIKLEPELNLEPAADDTITVPERLRSAQGP